MLKISIVELSEKLVVVRPEGHIAGPWVEALRKALEGELSDRKKLILDISDVSFVDGNGISLLTTLTTPQVALLNAQPFVTELLKSARG